jgi:hypothetical protein
VPHRAFGEHHAIGEHDGFVERAVAIRVFQSHDAMRLLDELLVGLVVRPGRIRNVEAALLIEVGLDGTENVIGAGDQFDLKTIRQGEHVRADLELSSARKHRQQNRQREKQAVMHDGIFRA